jgi:hypothetical protein
MLSNVLPLLAVTAGFLHIIYRHWAATIGNTRNLMTFYAEFCKDHANKAPEFFLPGYLQYFIDIYEGAAPTNTDWWPTVTQWEIDHAIPSDDAMHAYLTRELVKS